MTYLCSTLHLLSNFLSLELCFFNFLQRSQLWEQTSRVMLCFVCVLQAYTSESHGFQNIVLDGIESDVIGRISTSLNMCLKKLGISELVSMSSGWNCNEVCYSVQYAELCKYSKGCPQPRLHRQATTLGEALGPRSAIQNGQRLSSMSRVIIAVFSFCFMFFHVFACVFMCFPPQCRSNPSTSTSHQASPTRTLALKVGAGSLWPLFWKSM